MVSIGDDQRVKVGAPAARSLCDAFAIATLHYAYDQWRNFGKAPNQPAVLEVWDDYVAEIERIPEEVRHQHVHRGHNCWVVPEEERFVTRGLLPGGLREAFGLRWSVRDERRWQWFRRWAPRMYWALPAWLRQLPARRGLRDLRQRLGTG